MRGDLPVIFLHSPKTAGISLSRLLGVERLSHSWARNRLSERHWLQSYSVTIVRHPFERFLSGYYDHILKPNRNGLVKMYGWDIKNITAHDYLDVLAANPKYGGSQLFWTDYPSKVKPRADLVLRFEKIKNWKDVLLTAGIDVSSRDLSHRNKSERGTSNHLERLGLSADGFKQLERDVQAFFAADYKAFGYE
nr:sulfotransferase family 2 domain-containing protein [Octadecabacter algicola]